MGIHESQSRLYEIQIGRSYPFWEFFFPKLKEVFANNLSDVSLEDFYFAVNEVKPSLIRVEADEVSYQLHIILRYEIEQALFNGEVEVKDLPEIWNTKMQKYLGIEPKNNSEGVLQDIQWSMGHFGYFPTYLLGNLYAAQFMSAMKKDLGDLDGLISTGNLLPVLSWLREKIHNQGRRYTAQELVKNVTGEELNPAHFEQYLKNKYEPLYGVSW